MNTETNTNTNQKVKKQLEREDDLKQKIKILERQNMHLLGESSILRQNLIQIEKENYTLKERQNIFLLTDHKKSEEIKKELKTLQIENRIKENQLKALKTPKTIIFEELKPNWIFSNAKTDIQFSLFPFEYKRLKILHDFFYPEFEKLSYNVSKQICQFRSTKQFYKYFMLFSERKDVFDDLFMLFFVDYFDNQVKSKHVYKILCKCEFNWILGFLDKNDFMMLLNKFLDETVDDKNSLLFYYRVAKNRVFILNLFLPIKRFKVLLESRRKEMIFILDVLSDEVLRSYINAQTIGLFDNKYLKRAFKEDYFDVYCFL